MFGHVPLSALPPSLSSLEKVLEKMSRDWEGVEFRITEYKETGTYIMGGSDEIQVCNAQMAMHLPCSLL